MTIDFGALLSSILENSPTMAILFWLVWRYEMRTQELFDQCLKHFDEDANGGKMDNSA